MGIRNTMTLSMRKATLPSTEKDLEDMPFIAFEQPGRSKDAEHQKIIRKHLGRRRRKQTPERKQKKSTDPKEDILNILCTCNSDVPVFLHAAVNEGRVMALQLCITCGKHRLVDGLPNALSLSPSLGAVTYSHSDPFEALAVRATPYTHDLIKHFVHVTAPATLPVPHLAHLFPNNAAAISLIAHDEVLLQSAISIASMHRDFLRGSQGPNTVSLEEHGKAIALLNNSLSDTSKRPSDGLIITVAILCSCQMIAENFESWQAHMLGLQRLLELRGGLDPEDQIRDNVFECDAVGAAVFDVPPFLTAYVNSQGRELYGAATLPYELIVISGHLRRIFVEIRDLCQALDLFSCDPDVDKATIGDFVERRSAIEYGLLTMEDEDQDGASTAATQCCRLAAQILAHLVFRKMAPSSLIHDRLAGRLREAMIIFDEDRSSQHATSMFLWLSVLGYLALKNGPLRLWFAGWVSHCVSELDISNIEDLTYQLRKIAWSDQILSMPCEEMWDQLHQMQMMGVELKIMSET